jgi:acetolactate synthase-1/2/3 large subunit
MNLSDYVVEFFEKRDANHVFMVTGGGSMHLVNSFGKSSKIKYVCTHHEQSASFAAEAYSKMNNMVGLVLVTSGPGGTNTITGLAGAYQDSVPCIFISGQTKREQTIYNSGLPGLRQFGVQEVNIIPVVQSLTKYCHFLNDPEDIRYVLEKSYAIATTGRPGPVWIDIPLDVQNAQISPDELKGYDEGLDLKAPKMSTDDMNGVFSDIKAAHRPVIIAGHGIRLSHAEDLFLSFVEKMGIPVVTPIMGIDLLHTDHPYNIGKIGTKGTRAGNFTMQNADLILAIGTRLPVSVVGHDYSTFAREAKRIVVDIDPEEHQKKTIRIDKFIHADAKEFIESMMQMISEDDLASHKEWADFCKKQKERYPVCTPCYDDCDGINYYKFVDTLTHYAPASVPIVSDAGSAFYVAAQATYLKPGQRYITSGAIATMGFSLPASIGVSFALDQGMVIAITGDGSFQQNPQELTVLSYHCLPIKLFIAENNGYLTIRQTQKRFFDGHLVGESRSSGLSFPNLALLAKAYNIDYIKISSISQLEDSLKDIFSSDHPMLIEVTLMTDQEIIPTNSSVMNEAGKMVSKPLEDMYPFLDRSEFLSNMKIPPIL